MLPIYEIDCKCGSSLRVQVESSEILLRIYCKKCKAFILDQSPKSKEHVENAPTLLRTAEVLNQPKTSRMKEQKPSKFAHYSLVKLLGEGAMGKVYLAVDEKTGEKVALKALRKPDDGKALDYFIREVQVLRQLNHPNIVALKGWGNSHGYPYFAMEYIEGVSLEEMLKKGPLPAAHTVQLMSSLLDALVYAFQFQIIHRDIKPANILITNAGMVKLIDLGVGKILKQSQDLTHTGQMVGTGFYMPLEQLQDAKRADYRADIYAVGATMYHALAGIPPFGEHGKNLHKMLWAKVENTYITLGQRCPQLHSGLVRIVEKAMGHTPEDRYANAREMKEDLVDFYKKHLKS